MVTGSAPLWASDCFFLLLEAPFPCLGQQFLLDLGQGLILELLDRFIDAVEVVQVAAEFKGLLGLVSVIIFEDKSDLGHGEAPLPRGRLKMPQSTPSRILRQEEKIWSRT